MSDDGGALEQRPRSGLVRAEMLSRALSDAARRARLSTRAKRSFEGGGFRARRGDRRIFLTYVASFILMFALPTLSAIAYFGFIASDQYMSETRFTIRTGNPVTADGLASLTGFSAMMIIQDTQVVADYVLTRAAVERLDAAVGLRAMFSSPQIDFLARLKADSPIEKLVRFWNAMVSVSIETPSGIVVFRAKAFKAEDAARIAKAVVDLSEQLVNEMNDRIERDNVADAEAAVDKAAARFAAARTAFETVRNQEGILDVQAAATSVGGLIVSVRTTQLKLQADYNSHLGSVSESAPQMKELKSRIDALSEQIQQLEAQMTSVGSGAGSPRVLSASMTKFDKFDLDQKVAEVQYAKAVNALESAHIKAEHKMVYLTTFVQPTAPDEARYPRRGLWILGVASGSLLVWGIFCGLLSAARNHMA